MTRSEHMVDKKKRIAAFILLIIAVAVVTVAVVLPSMNEYHFYVKDTENEISLQGVQVEDSSVVEVSSTDRVDGYIQVTFRALDPGRTVVEVSLDGKDYKSTVFITLQVSSSGRIIREGMFDFNNWMIAFVGLLVDLLLISLLLLSEFVSRIRRDLYSYRTLQTGGIAVFVTLITLMFIVLCLLIGPHFKDYCADMVLMMARVIFTLFVLCAIPFVIVFGIALSISNVILIRREGFRKVNLLGIALSVFLVVGLFLCIASLGEGSPTEAARNHMISNIQFVVSSVFCFFLCFMLSTMICGLIAARRVPERNKDFIIILGCAIKEDGTLYPLLQGRVDRALWFWHKQLEETGKRAVFVPSGGQGSDEVMSEGEAMMRYLLEQGVPQECIMPEMASTSTYENMAFSKKLIDEREQDAEVIFSTTNYHVFRSGILAGQAGLDAAGIGSRSKWYFWPNAFVREFAGLLVSAWKLELGFFAAIALLAIAIIIFI